MRSVYDCVAAFSRLLDIEYDIILGRKGRALKIRLGFDKTDAFHLMGLHYLRDLPGLRKGRDKVFDDISDGKITSEFLESSSLYSRIERRVDMLPLLESFIDSNELYFRYDPKLNKYSSISAELLMSNSIDNNGAFLFLKRGDKESMYMCCSFFPQDGRDYAYRQPVWKQLFKKKINLTTGAETILFNRLQFPV